MKHLFYALKNIANLDISKQIMPFPPLSLPKSPDILKKRAKTTPLFACKRHAVYDNMYSEQDISREIDKYHYTLKPP